jgi:hypothetical protein
MAIKLGVQQGGDEGSLDMRSSADHTVAIDSTSQLMSMPQHMQILENLNTLTTTTSTTMNDCNDVRHPLRPCGACPFCAGGCGDDACQDCVNGPCPSGCPANCTRYYTICEVRRHNTEKSAWLLAGDDIYDVTEYLRQNLHPGGMKSILTKAGGVRDCSTDLMYHSKDGRQVWQKYHVGKLTKCPSQNGQPVLGKEWWKFWG